MRSLIYKIAAIPVVLIVGVFGFVSPLYAQLEQGRTIHLEETEYASGISQYAVCGDRIFITDFYHRTLAVYKSDGTFIRHYRSTGRGPGDFGRAPIHLLCTRSGGILTVDLPNRFHLFDKDLNFLETGVVDFSGIGAVVSLGQPLAEFDGSWLFALSGSGLPDGFEFARVSKTDFSIQAFGFSEEYPSRLARSRHSYYDSGYIVSGYIFTGNVKVMEVETGDYTVFSVLDDKAPGVAAAAGNRQRPRIDEREMEIAREGYVINSIFMHGGNVYMIPNAGFDRPFEVLLEFNLHGEFLREIELPVKLTRIVPAAGVFFGTIDGLTLYRLKAAF